MGSEDRDKALELAFTQIEKQFGKGSIMKLGKAESLKGIQVVPTGSISLDHALGVGGVPRGRVIEIYGPEGSGCLLYTSPSPRDATLSRMPSSA